MHKFIQGKDGMGYLAEKLSHGNYRKILKEENVAEYTESEEIY